MCASEGRIIYNIDVADEEELIAAVQLAAMPLASPQHLFIRPINGTAGTHVAAAFFGWHMCAIGNQYNRLGAFAPSRFSHLPTTVNRSRLPARRLTVCGHFQLPLQH